MKCGEAPGSSTSGWAADLTTGGDTERRLGGVDVLGFFTAEHGVGEAGRALVSTLDCAEVLRNTINYADTESRTGYHYATDDTSAHKVLFLAVNADHIPAAHGIMGGKFFADRYLISQWFWELETPPPWFSDAFSLIDELWAPTRFIEQMLRRCAPAHVKVHLMPPAFRVPETDSRLERGDFGLDDRFMFLFSFDFMSIAKRKNAVGLVRAFRKAFGENEGPRLVIKSINSDKRPEDRDDVSDAIDGRDDIIHINRYVSRVEASTLTSLADCYVSLHRSEGLGLTITEAISLGIPTIATAYSGNLDFMDAWNTWRVPCTMTRVGPGAGGYDREAQWAEPDLDVAAGMMREVWENPEAARERAGRARDWLLASFTPEVAGARMKARLEEIWADLGRG